MLVLAKDDAEFNKYLAYILSDAGGTNIGDSARIQAAVLLKNNIKSIKKGAMSDADFTLITNAVLAGLRDIRRAVRNGVAIIAPQLYSKGKPARKQDLFDGLFGIIENRAGDNSHETKLAQGGAMTAIANICEDNTDDLEKGYNGERPLNYVIPKLVEATKVPSEPRPRQGAGVDKLLRL